MLSVAAATLANAGVCPIAGREVLPTEVVKKTLAVMECAGIYDNAGVFTLEVGLPAKSDVSGAVMVVVLNLLGFATFSSRLDPYGNSLRGVEFCRQLVDCFTVHVYDSLSAGHTGCCRVTSGRPKAVASCGIFLICVGLCPMVIAMQSKWAISCLPA